MPILPNVLGTRISRRTLLASAATLPPAVAACSRLVPAAPWSWPPDGAARLARWAGRQAERPLFRRFPGLLAQVPWLPLTDSPTPVEPLTALQDALGLHNLWIKRDDLSSTLYGGNKVRKNEFLLAAAVAQGAGHLLTMGGIGSHHCASVAAFGRRLGLATTIVQTPQPLNDHVRHMLRLQAAFGAHQVLADNEVEQLLILRREFARLTAAGERPYFIWAGGSTPLGTLGYVDAGLELAEQIAAGALPEPEALFVATGSGGSHAGLACAMQIAGLRTRVIGVRVVPWPVASFAVVTWLADHCLANLAAAGANVEPRLDRDRFELDTGHLGAGYGAPLPAGERLRAAMAEHEGIALEPTYTAKTLAAMVAYATRHPAHGPLLFWNTYSSAVEPPLPPHQALPRPYHRFFAT